MSSAAGVPTNPAVPAPGVSSSYKNGWEKLKKYFLELLLVGVVGALLDGPGNFGTFKRDTSAMSFFSFIYAILVGGPVTYGVSYASLKAARDEKPEINDVFAAFKTYRNAILANLLVIVIIVIGFVLLVVPGVIFAIKLSFTPYLVVERKMEAVEAVKESWRMTNGHGWTIFGIGLLGIPIVIGGLLLLVVGVIPAILWIELAGASFYHSVSQTRGAAQAAP